MQTQEMEKDLVVLTEELNRRERIDSSGMCTLKFQISLEDLRSCLDNVRVGFKYLAFDIEVTQRENEYLRNLLEERHDS